MVFKFRERCIDAGMHGSPSILAMHLLEDQLIKEVPDTAHSAVDVMEKAFASELTTYKPLYDPNCE
jgi:hypothetical protein